MTGGAGFIGCQLVRALIESPAYADFDILVLDDLSGGFQDNIPVDPRVSFRRVDIRDNQLIDAVFEGSNIRIVFHLAAYAAEGLSHFIRRFNYQTNLVGTMNILNAAVRAEVQHFVFTSSIAVYGAAQVPMRDDTIPHPEDPYGISKWAAELDLAAAREMFGLNYTVFRPHNVYGEYQNIGDRYRNVVGIFMNRILQNEPLPIFGDGSQQRAFTYVKDLLQPMLAAPFTPEANGTAFNIGANQPVSVLELAEKVCDVFGVKPQLRFLPARSEVHLAWSDHSRCQRVFGKLPETDLAEGLQSMAAWVQTTGARSSSTFENIEVTKNLPASWKEPLKSDKAS
ncbi:MAG: NAD-dependent epimerase/dehydratase family protein [Planctomycetaceae bacterium]